jgi:cob(I)alamin adenosyltransferase
MQNAPDGRIAASYNGNMGFRLSRIVTRTGDDGTTGLGDGTRTPKHHPRIAAMGDIDELNSALGCVLAEELPAPVRELLGAAQNDLFDLGGEICIPGRVALLEEQVAALDRGIAQFNAQLPPLREFVLPGGTRAGAACHLARTVCRRAERSLAALGQGGAVSALALQYLNRLSDLLFILARAINTAKASPEQVWRPTARSGTDGV